MIIMLMKKDVTVTLLMTNQGCVEFRRHYTGQFLNKQALHGTQEAAMDRYFIGSLGK